MKKLSISDNTRLIILLAVVVEILVGRGHNNVRLDQNIVRIVELVIWQDINFCASSS